MIPQTLAKHKLLLVSVPFFQSQSQNRSYCPQNGGWKQYLIPEVEFCPGGNLPFHLQKQVHTLSTLQWMHQPQFFWVKFLLLCSVLAEFILSYLSSLFFIPCPTLSLYCLFPWPPCSWLLGVMFPSLSVWVFSQIFVHGKGKAGLTTVWLFLWPQLIFFSVNKVQ